jgi:hypothetical protein
VLCPISVCLPACGVEYFFGMLPQATMDQIVPLIEEYEKAMISFALAQELKNAGLAPSKNTNAVSLVSG